jgi:hypothetical protein
MLVAMSSITYGLGRRAGATERLSHSVFLEEVSEIAAKRNR